jgi:hypothetical protein
VKAVLERPGGLHDVLDEVAVDPAVVEEHAGPRRRADARDAPAPPADVEEQREQPLLGVDHPPPKLIEPVGRVEAVLLLLAALRLESRRRLAALALYRPDADRAAVGRDPLAVDDGEAGPLEDRGQRAQPVEAEVLVVDRVVLEPLDEVEQVMRLGNEDAAVG